jgi:undecaprenyl-diphosphatase
MTFVQILILAIVQGVAELLPVSSSAHVIVAQKLMGLDPTAPEMTLMLVMLHTGTMFAVIVYFWRAWKVSFFASFSIFRRSLGLIALATFCTGVIGLALKEVIENSFLKGVKHAEIELLFGNMNLIAAALFAVGILIVVAGIFGKRFGNGKEVGLKESLVIGVVQGLCLPFRGFSRSGATISAGLLMGVARMRAEEFSFALAVVLTPPVIAREVLRLMKAQGEIGAKAISFTDIMSHGALGMGLSFLAGLVALRWLSQWLERGRWQLFGLYCLCASLTVFILHQRVF